MCFVDSLWLSSQHTSVVVPVKGLQFAACFRSAICQDRAASVYLAFAAKGEPL